MKTIEHYRALGLNLLLSHVPRSPFRFEPTVSLGQVDVHPGVMIGLASYMNSGFVRSGVKIGRYCSIGRNVTIGTGHHEMGGLSTSPHFKSSRMSSSLKLADPVARIRVKVGHDVWIGDNVLILSGVTVGQGAVLAAGSVVTKDVPPYAVVAGVPARVVKYRFDDVLNQRILSLNWHEFDPEALCQLDLSDIYETIERLEGWGDEMRTAKGDRFVVI